MTDDRGWVETGIVYISENADLELPFDAHWETECDGKGVFLEDSPGFDRAEDAVAWGRSRSPMVLIRLGPPDGPQRYFSAGERQPPGEQLPEWRPGE